MQATTTSATGALLLESTTFPVSTELLAWARATELTSIAASSNAGRRRLPRLSLRMVRVKWHPSTTA